MAAEPPLLYRFGGWLLLMPAEANPEALEPGPYVLRMPTDGIELMAYWQGGRTRAVALHFDAQDFKKDYVVLKSFLSSSRLKGCGIGPVARIKPLKNLIAKDAVALELPEHGALLLAGSDRGLRRVGELLVADLGSARVQLMADSPVVRVGEWDSAEFCRYELKQWLEGGDETN